MQAMVHIFTRVAEIFGQEVSQTKTKIMVIKGTQNREPKKEPDIGDTAAYCKTLQAKIDPNHNRNQIMAL